MKGYVHIGRCPVCHQLIKEPFSATSGPVPFIHRPPKRRSCRLIVIPDPEGEEHQKVQVGRQESLEDALLRALEEAA